MHADLTCLLGATPVAAEPAQDEGAVASSRLRLVGWWPQSQTVPRAPAKGWP